MIASSQGLDSRHEVDLIAEARATSTRCDRWILRDGQSAHGRHARIACRANLSQLALVLFFGK
jgi:hypothetical protein